jgi:hypothetical protein
MLSRKKGRQYGEGHQKALQISVRLLPFVGVLVGGRERASCQASGPSAILGLCVSMPLLPCGWEHVPLPTRRRCRKECDGLSGHEAAEISSPTLLRGWRLCRWRSHGRLYIAQCGVDAYTRCIQSKSRVGRRPPPRVAVALSIRLALSRSVQIYDSGRPSAFRKPNNPVPVHNKDCVIMTQSFIVYDMIRRLLKFGGNP